MTEWKMSVETVYIYIAGDSAGRGASTTTCTASEGQLHGSRPLGHVVQPVAAPAASSPVSRTGDRLRRDRLWGDAGGCEGRPRPRPTSEGGAGTARLSEFCDAFRLRRCRPDAAAVTRVCTKHSAVMSEAMLHSWLEVYRRVDTVNGYSDIYVRQT